MSRNALIALCAGHQHRGVRTTRLHRPRAKRSSVPTALRRPRPPHPAANVRDDREPSPTVQRDGRTILLIWGGGKAIYVFRKYLTGFCKNEVICPTGRHATRRSTARSQTSVVQVSRRRNPPSLRDAPTADDAALIRPTLPPLHRNAETTIAPTIATVSVYFAA